MANIPFPSWLAENSPFTYSWESSVYTRQPKAGEIRKSEIRIHGWSLAIPAPVPNYGKKSSNASTSFSPDLYWMKDPPKDTVNS